LRGVPQAGACARLRTPLRRPRTRPARRTKWTPTGRTPCARCTAVRRNLLRRDLRAPRGLWHGASSRCTRRSTRPRWASRAPRGGDGVGPFTRVRFLAEHYGPRWDAGPLVGTRTVLSNRVHRFFWNNINYHIGHPVYPRVPWYHLERLHALLLPEIQAAGAIVDPRLRGGLP